MTDNIINIGDKKKGSQARTVKQLIQKTMDNTSEGGDYQNANKAIIILTDSTNTKNTKTCVNTTGLNIIEVINKLELVKSIMLQTLD